MVALFYEVCKVSCTTGERLKLYGIVRRRGGGKKACVGRSDGFYGSSPFIPKTYCAARSF